MSQHQTLASGNPVGDKFKGLGITNQVMRCNPRYCLGMLSGPPACGKTNLMASCDGAFILNLDQSSMPTETAEDLHAGVWPGINEHGQCIDADGTPFVLTWDTVLKKLQDVKQLAIDGKPHPDFVVLDTLATALDLGSEFIVRKHGKKEWKDCHGPSAWDDLYRMLLGVAFDLRRVGIGFWYICHITNSFIPLGENQYKETPTLTITDKFWGRIHPRLELSLVMRSDWVAGDKIKKMVDGTERRFPGQGPKVRKAYLTINDETYSGITKGRVDFQDLDIPKVGGWDVFEDAYTDNPQA